MQFLLRQIRKRLVQRVLQKQMLRKKNRNRWFLVLIREGKKMSSLIKLSATLVALEFLYIMYLETFATASEKTSQVFGMEIEELKRKSVNTLFRNQGIYNGLLAVLILLAVWVPAELQ